MPSLEEQLRTFSQTPKFQELCKAAKKKAEKGGKPFGQDSRAVVRAPEFYAKEMQRILREKIAKIRSEATGDAYLDHIAYKVREDGADVYFEPSEMTRPSLDPAYNDGSGIAVENIAVLINNGYRARGTVRGVDRHGSPMVSRPNRQGEHFMQAAVNEFNDRYGDEVSAELDTKYW